MPGQHLGFKGRDMMDDKQTEGRQKNGAMPGGKPDASTSNDDVRKTGKQERKSAGPDGPDASVIGETFKR